MMLTPGFGFAFASRTATGGTVNYSVNPSNAAPNNWVCLVRNGNSFTGYYSSNGTTWTQLGATSISMASAVQVGLVVSAATNSTLSTATFDNVQITTSTTP